MTRVDREALGAGMRTASYTRFHERKIPNTRFPDRPGQHTLTMRDTKTGDAFGSVSFSPAVHEKRLSIDVLEVPHEHRGKGYAGQVMDELQRRYPDHVIDHGSRTEAGQAWRSSYGEGTADQRGRTAALEADAAAYAAFSVRLANSQYRNVSQLTDEDLDDNQRRALHRLKGEDELIQGDRLTKLMEEHGIHRHDSSPEDDDPDAHTSLQWNVKRERFLDADHPLHTSQDYLHKPTLERLIRSPMLMVDKGDHFGPRVYQEDHPEGRYWLQEGHHRTMADRMTQRSGWSYDLRETNKQRAARDRDNPEKIKERYQVKAAATMYHWAPKWAREDIAEHGLDHTRSPEFNPDSHGPHGIFMHHDHATSQDWIPDIHQTHDLYAVDVNGLRIKPDPYDTGDASYSEKPIPANRLRRVTAADDGWSFTHHHVEGPHWRSFGDKPGGGSVMAEYKLRDGGIHFDSGTLHEHQVRKHGPEAVERLHDAVREHHGLDEAPPEAAAPQPTRRAPRVYYHGTTTEDVTHILPAARHGQGVMFRSDTSPEHAYASLSKDAAWSYAEKAHHVTGGKPRVYQVRPLHGDHSHVEKDPQWENGRLRGNYEGDRRSKVGFEVVRELKTPRHIHESFDWPGKEDGL